jgi:hypothetical protein
MLANVASVIHVVQKNGGEAAPAFEVRIVRGHYVDDVRHCLIERCEMPSRAN